MSTDAAQKPRTNASDASDHNDHKNDDNEDDSATGTGTGTDAGTDGNSFDAPLVGQVSFGNSWEQRCQTLAMFSCSLYFILPSVLVMWAVTMYGLVGRPSVMGSSSPSLVTALIALYLGFVFVVDKSPTSGTRSPFLRRFRTWWSWSCDYLPLLLVKTADLPADKDEKYILGYHPHGIISVGCFGAFATDGARTLDLTKTSTKKKKKEKLEEDASSSSSSSKETLVTLDQVDDTDRGFSSLFPGLDRRVITLPQNFQTPFLREYFLSMGAVTSAKETFRTVLQRPKTALVVVVGGASESLQSLEGSMDLVLEKRKGFVREAILAQAALVPVLGFGETDLYRVFHPEDGDPEHSWITNLQDVLKRWTGFGMPIFQGRSLLFQEIGIMPQKKPVVVVVGAPIPPPPLNMEKRDAFHPEIDRTTGKALNDDGKVLNEHHAKYMDALEDLYNTYKDASWNVPGRRRRKSMTIVK